MRETGLDLTNQQEHVLIRSNRKWAIKGFGI